MAVAGFLIQFVAAIMMLLFAVRFVRTGIERRFGQFFQTVLTGHTSGVVAGLSGLAMAVVMQSATAVALLLTGFAAAGSIGFGFALAGVLGADLGSALVVQVLSFDLSWLQPLLLALGGWLYLKSGQGRMRLNGRILLGIAFILMSLQLLRDAVEPIRDSGALPAIAGYLANDYLTAFMAGAALAFAMHSSVAAVLTCVTLVHVGALHFDAGLSLVLGANLGSAFIPVWLTRGMEPSARRVPAGNLLIRGTGAIVILLGINLFGLSEAFHFASPGQSLLFAHIGFNLIVAVLGVALIGVVEPFVARLLPVPVDSVSVLDRLMEPVNALDNPAGKGPEYALTAIRQELLQMVTRIERMLRTVTDLFETADEAAITALWEEDDHVNSQLAQIRRFVARLPRKKSNRVQLDTARGLFDYAIRLESAGDIVSKRLTTLARSKQNQRISFSRAGWAEIMELHGAVLGSFTLARHVLLAGDVDSARQLVLDKAEIKRMERASRKAHLKRLEKGKAESFQSSDLHLEIIRTLRDLHGHIAAVAYPILYRNGQVLETRLITDEDDINEDETAP